MQGIGVNTPRAAAVADATAGFARDVHIIKGGIFTNGLLSIILAAGLLLVIVLFFGKTIKLEGPVPKVHNIEAPIQTNCPICDKFY